jgi:serine/threonine-protein kinase RsbW
LSANKNKFLIVTPSESKYLDVIREFVAKVATIAGFDDEHVNKIQLSVDEACTNVVKHAYRGMDSRDIKIQIEFDKKMLEVSVEDKGKGFDLKTTKLDDIDNYLNEFRKGGLGIHLMKILMDSVKYSIQPSKRTQVKMIKYLDQNGKPNKKK